MSMRPRTREDDARYDAISRKAIKNMRAGEWAPVDPAKFTSTVDYLKWCDRVGDGTGVWDASLPTGGVGKPNLYDAVRKLRGEAVRTPRQESGRRIGPPGATETPLTERRNPVKHVLTTASGGVVAFVVLTNHSLTRHAHLTHRQEAFIAAVIVVGVDLILLAIVRALKPKPPVTPQRPGYTGTRF